MDGDTRPDVDWPAEAVEQLDRPWTTQLRPRFDGLTDEEYLWEPAPGCWSLRRRADGTFGRDGEYPAPEPPPVTTIAWRIGHLVVDCLGGRAARHFGGPPVTDRDWRHGGTAVAGLAQLDEAYQRWTRGVRALGRGEWARPCGPAERHHADAPLAALVLHINREVLHHGAEIAVLRDLYRAGVR